MTSVRILHKGTLPGGEKRRGGEGALHESYQLRREEREGELVEGPKSGVPRSTRYLRHESSEGGGAFGSLD